MFRIRLRIAALLAMVVAGSSGPAPHGHAADLHALEAYEGGAKQVEDQYVGFLAGFFGRPAAPGERLLRGTHAVGTCTAAKFEIYDIKASADVPEEYAVGVFAEPQTVRRAGSLLQRLGLTRKSRQRF